METSRENLRWSACDSSLQSDEMLSSCWAVPCTEIQGICHWEARECCPSPLGVVCPLVRSRMLTLCMKWWQLCIQMKLSKYQSACAKCLVCTGRSATANVTAEMHVPLGSVSTNLNDPAQAGICLSLSFKASTLHIFPACCYSEPWSKVIENWRLFHIIQKSYLLVCFQVTTASTMLVKL